MIMFPTKTRRIIGILSLMAIAVCGYKTYELYPVLVIAWNEIKATVPWLLGLLGALALLVWSLGWTANRKLKKKWEVIEEQKRKALKKLKGKH
jgi:hypothetical protein